MGPAGDLWLPQDGKDLSIYKRMLKVGAIKPYLMPQGVERLGEHVMRMFEVAQAGGRMRDAIKCIEILRQLMNDNRQMALEVDKVDRLDAGKPTTISGQVSPEVEQRIKRIISVQRVIPNTETGHGTERQAGPVRDSGGAGRGGVEPPAQGGGGEQAPERADQGAEASCGEREAAREGEEGVR